MAITIELRQQIQTLQQQISLNEKGPKKIELEIAIDRMARTIIETPLNTQERQELLDDLLRVRTQMIRHVPVNRIKGTCLFLNLIQRIPPSPICPAYNKMSFPTASTYHSIGSNISCIRLDPNALKYVPKNVLEKAGPLEGIEVDLLWTAIDGRFSNRAGRSLNHSSHPWAHRHALPGPESILVDGKERNNSDSNISFDVDMGIFPEIGLEASKEAGAIAINHISPMNVHVHAREAAKAPQSGDMLFSPDNAHFRVIPGSPFSMDWSVMKKDDRIAITKRLILFDYDHPICKALLHTIRNCDDLEKHLQRLDRVPNAIQETFLPLVKAFESHQPEAMEIFHQLPLAFQHGIYYETWVLFDSPRGIHGDFGRASFEKSSSLDEKYQCDDHQCAAAVRRFSARLEHLLVNSQFDLLLRSQSLTKGDNILTMMKCAQLFYKNPNEALNAFEQLPQQEKEAVRFAFWELNRCPRIHNFSADQFPMHVEDKHVPMHVENKHEIKTRIQAILLAASRQTHQFEKPIVEGLTLIQNEKMGGEKSDQEFDALVVSNYVEIPVEKKEESDFEDLTPAVEEHILKHEQKHESVEPSVSLRALVSQQITELVFNPEFQSFDNSTKASLVNEILSPLEQDLKNRIYGGVYSHSSDPKKGGKSWGEFHVADDLDALINSIQEVLTPE